MIIEYLSQQYFGYGDSNDTYIFKVETLALKGGPISLLFNISVKRRIYCTLIP